MKKLLLLLLFLSLVTSCTSAKKTCFCKYNMYKPVEREHSTIAIFMADGDFEQVSKYFTENGDKAIKLTQDDISILDPILKRLDDDKYDLFTDEEKKILASIKSKFKADLILVAKSKHEILTGLNKEFNLLVLYTFDIDNECCAFFQKEYFPPKETFTDKLIETIKTDRQW